MLLNNQWIKEKVKQQIKNSLETNENITFQNLWEAAKTVLRGKIIAVQVDLKKQEGVPKKQSNSMPKELKKEKKK